MKINREIRASKVRVIDSEGQQQGILSLHEALALAEREGLDLVEISPSARPPVCKVMDYGKFRYDQTKREKESKKAQHQIKVKEIKIRPNIDSHDLETKLRQARQFLLKGNKVKFTCVFRGREMMFKEQGFQLLQQVCVSLEDICMVEATPKMMGRMLTAVVAPAPAKKKKEVNH